MKRIARGILILAFAVPAFGTTAPAPPPPGAAASDHFDPVAATNAYLATVPPADRARSDAYFEGGYWLQLWDFLLSAGIALLLLATGLSATFRDLAERIAPWPAVQSVIYGIELILAMALLSFPLGVYEGYFREHRYGLANQTFGPWMKDQIVGLAVEVVLGALLVAVLYAVLRRAPRTWWIWGSMTGIVFFVFVALIGPIWIAPLFNKYTKLADPAVREPILRLARSEGISAADVYVVDASRQSKRVSANVSGFLGTERITLNDNLLNRCSLPEIEAVMGHEMGHDVLHHVYKGTLFFGLLVVIGFALVRRTFERITRNGRWGIRGTEDVAGLPLLFLLILVYFFLLTPVANTYIRTEEAEADLFGINASRQPDGEAQVDLKLAEYRKLDPTPFEEFLFFDHPSGRNRILMAMRWKAENLAPAGTARTGIVLRGPEGSDRQSRPAVGTLAAGPSRTSRRVVPDSNRRFQTIRDTSPVESTRTGFPDSSKAIVKSRRRVNIGLRASAKSALRNRPSPS